MKELSQIAQLIDKNKPRKIEILGNEDASSNYAKLYDLICEGTVTTDEEAAAHIYGDAKTPNDSAYRQFKSRFKERLMNMLFFLDKGNAQATDLQNATLSIQKEWAAINIIYAKGNFLLAAKLAEDLLPYAIKYELTEVVIYIADRLRQGYGTQIDNRKRYDELKKLQTQYMELWRLEILARDFFHDIRMDYIKSSANQSQSKEKAVQSWAILQPYLAENKSYQFITYTYAVGLAQYGTSVEDLKTTIALCDEAIALLSEKAFVPKRQIATFMNPKIACHRQLKEQTAGESIVKEVLLLQEEGSLTWFKTKENQALLAFHTKEYDKAFEIWEAVYNHKSYKTLTLLHYEIWQLFGAYLYFLAASGKMGPLSINASKVRISKFLNEIPTFNTDKAGMNVPSLIVHIAILIAEKKHNAIPDRLEALIKYWQRHIRKTDTTYRSHCFIKMLKELPNAHYKRVGVEARTKLILRDLTAVSINLDQKDFKSEVIPLEDLWAILLSLT